MHLCLARDLAGLEGPRWPRVQGWQLVLAMGWASALLHVASHPLED